MDQEVMDRGDLDMWWIASGRRDKVLVVFCENEKAERFHQALSLCNHTLALCGLPNAQAEGIPELIPESLHDRDLFLRVRSALGSCDNRLFPNMPMILSSSGGLRALGLGYNKVKVTRAAYLALAISAAFHQPSMSESPSHGLMGSLIFEASRAKDLEQNTGGQSSLRPSPTSKVRPSSYKDKDKHKSSSHTFKERRSERSATVSTRGIDEEVPDWQEVLTARFINASTDGPRPPSSPPPRPPSSLPPEQALPKGKPHVWYDMQGGSQDNATPAYLLLAASRVMQRRSVRRNAPHSSRSRSRSPLRSNPSSGIETADDRYAVSEQYMQTSPSMRDDVSEREFTHSSPGNLRMEMVNELAKGASRFDPAQDDNACVTQSHLLRELDVRSLRQTHSDVSRVFRHGTYSGTRVVDLTTRLLQGATTVDDLPPLVVVRLRKENWVVFGNRRLRALKDYCEKARINELPVNCITYDVDCESELPSQLAAKLLVSTTTQNRGCFAPFGQWRKRKYIGHGR